MLLIHQPFTLVTSMKQLDVLPGTKQIKCCQHSLHSISCFASGHIPPKVTPFLCGAGVLASKNKKNDH